MSFWSGWAGWGRRELAAGDLFDYLPVDCFKIAIGKKEKKLSELGHRRIGGLLIIHEVFLNYKSSYFTFVYCPKFPDFFGFEPLWLPISLPLQFFGLLICASQAPL